jgi:hypothetical protein
LEYWRNAFNGGRFLCPEKGVPNVMLTVKAFRPQDSQKSMKLGVVTFLPKEKLFHLKEDLEDVVLALKHPWK